MAVTPGKRSDRSHHDSARHADLRARHGVTRHSVEPGAAARVSCDTNRQHLPRRAEGGAERNNGFMSKDKNRSRGLGHIGRFILIGFFEFIHREYIDYTGLRTALVVLNFNSNTHFQSFQFIQVNICSTIRNRIVKSLQSISKCE